MKKILGKLISLIALVLSITSCDNVSQHNVADKKTVALKKDGVPKKTHPLTDSARLMLHLDSLSRPSFPYLSQGRNYKPLITISFADFKHKKLFTIPLKLIPIAVGGGDLDHGLELDENGMLPDSVKETVDLVDSITYKAEAVLVATTPKFVVIDFTGTLVTMNYKVEVIEAIRSSQGHGNNHWQVWRETIIKKGLKMQLQQYYTHESHEDDDSVTEDWFIDANGHFQKKMSKAKEHN